MVDETLKNRGYGLVEKDAETVTTEVLINACVGKRCPQFRVPECPISRFLFSRMSISGMSSTRDRFVSLNENQRERETDRETDRESE